MWSQMWSKYCNRQVICLSALAMAAAPLLIAQVQGLAVPLEEPLGGKPTPKWEAGSLIGVESSASSAIEFRLYDKSGRRTSTIPFAIPDATYISLRNWTRSDDGTIALCGSATDHAGRSAGFIAWIDGATSQTQIVRTSPYQVSALALAADGSIWTAGAVHVTSKESPPADLGLFRQFDRSGKLLRSIVPQAGKEDAVAMASRMNVFAVLKDSTVLWYSAAQKQLISVSKEGAVNRITDLALPADQTLITGFGISADGVLYASARGRETWSTLRLNAGGDSWVPVHQAQGDSGMRQIYGVDGQALVASSRYATHVEFLPISDLSPN